MLASGLINGPLRSHSIIRFTLQGTPKLAFLVLTCNVPHPQLQLVMGHPEHNQCYKKA
jgi:hypothetical protein